ncbi:MAG TPA: HoxN/HupN/NixA family nickel/cobalt transporter, partial [Amycolatopsis sp.]|nr:HoxN/HupN/NixA family nickel/cobalt transporter [Amycolatopsis sp.]
MAGTDEDSRRGLSRREWVSIGGMGGFILLLNVVGWGVLTAFVVPHHYALGTSGVFGIGLGVTAFTLGMRHAFDADHIA